MLSYNTLESLPLSHRIWTSGFTGNAGSSLGQLLWAVVQLVSPSTAAAAQDLLPHNQPAHEFHMLVYTSPAKNTFLPLPLSPSKASWA